MPLFDENESAGGDDLLDRARANFQAGRPWDAVRDLERYLAAHPNDPSTRALLAIYLRYVGHGRESARHLKDALKRGPRDPLVNLIAGKIALEEGDPAQAEEHLLTTLDLVPRDEHAQRLLAESRLRRGDAAGALELAERALAGHPESAGLWAMVGRCRRAAGRDDARAALEKALELDGGEADALHALGEHHLEFSRFDEAAGCFRRAVAANPSMDISRRMLVRTRYWQSLSDDSERLQGPGRAALMTVVVALALLLVGRLSSDALLGRSVTQGVVLLAMIAAGIVGYYATRFVQAKARARRELSS